MSKHRFMQIFLIPIMLFVIVLSGCITVKQKTDVLTPITATIYIDFGSASVNGYDPGNYVWNGSSMEFISKNKSVIWIYTTELKASATVYDLLINFSKVANFKVEQIYYSYGVFIISIFGIKNQGYGGMNWQYWVNGKYGDVACDQKPLKKGDIVVWRYTSDPFE